MFVVAGRMFEKEQMLECVKCEKKFHLRCVTDKTFKEQEEWYLWGVLCWMEGRSSFCLLMDRSGLAF